MNSAKHWDVEIRVDHKSVLIIGSNYLSGVDDIDKHSDIIRNCAEHLLAFIGPEKALDSIPLICKPE